LTGDTDDDEELGGGRDATVAEIGRELLRRNTLAERLSRVYTVSTSSSSASLHTYIHTITC